MKQGILLIVGIVVALAAGVAGGYYYGYRMGMQAGGVAGTQEMGTPEEDLSAVAEEANPFSDIQEQINPWASGYENPFAVE